MTAPDRIWIGPLNSVECNPQCQGFTGEDPDWQHGSWYPHDIKSVEPNAQEYVRADLARAPQAHPLASEARMALERDDVAGWIGSLPKAPLAEALAVPEVKAAELYVVWSHEHGCWWRPDSAGYTNDVRAAGVYTRAEAMSISHRGRDGWRAGTKPDELPVRVTDLPDWAQAALRAIGEPRNG